MSAICVNCDSDYNPKRLALGYKTCLECGESEAVEEKVRKSKCTAPAYNKGAYMYVSSSSEALDIGR